MRTPIVLQLRDSEGEAGFLQELAGQTLWSALPVMPESRPGRRPSQSSPGSSSEWRVVYDGPGLVDGGLARMRSERGDDGARRVEFEDGERFWIDPDGDRVVRVNAVSDGDRSLERALGAPLALALAARGVFMIHAAALLARRGVLALTADSGAGKSTLAAAAARHPDLDLARIADDLLPVRLGPAPAALPHFPQLKLSAAEAYGPGAPAVLSWLALVEIEHSAAYSTVELERLGRADACRAIARATVAARLFDRGLLTAHFDACAEASAAVAVFRLRYPSGRERLREPLAALAALGLAG